MTSPNPLPDLVRQERQAFIDTLGSLTPAQWQEQSLCSAWRVVDVAAHLAWAPVLGPVAGSAAMVRHRFSMNRVIAATAIGWSDRGPKAIVEQLRRNLESGAKPVGLPMAAALADTVVHGIDVRRPLALEHTVPPGAVGPVADFALRTRWPLSAVIGGSSRRRVGGVRLVVTDADWRHGDGPEVTLTSDAALRLVYGRRISPDEVTGEGAAALLARM